MANVTQPTPIPEAENSKGEQATRIDKEEVGGVAMTASGPSLWIVVHTNESGHSFATRVTALDKDDAGDQILAAHADNLLIDAVPDHGEAQHGYGGKLLDVVNLTEEP